MSLLIEYLRRELGELLKEGVRFRFVGMRDRLPAEVQSILDEAMESTKDNTGMDLCVLVNYGSRQRSWKRPFGGGGICGGKNFRRSTRRNLKSI